MLYYGLGLEQENATNEHFIYYMDSEENIVMALS